MIMQGAFYLLVTFLPGKSLFAQTVKAMYKCSYFSNLKNSSVSDTGFPVSMRIIYTVFADNRFIEITGKLEDATAIPGADINYKSGSTRVIADIQNKLIYFQDERILKTIKEYKFDSENKIDTIIGFHLCNADTAIRVRVKKDIAVPITPGLFIVGTKGFLPIESIKTPYYNIELISVEQIKDKKLNYDTLFKKLMLQKPDGYFDFLHK